VGGEPLDPSASKERTTLLQPRSLQMSTAAPVVPGASSQWKVGVCEVTVAVESGAMGRGGSRMGMQAMPHSEAASRGESRVTSSGESTAASDGESSVTSKGESTGGKASREGSASALVALGGSSSLRAPQAMTAVHAVTTVREARRQGREVGEAMPERARPCRGRQRYSPER
jgi:hypothetical protein